MDQTLKDKLIELGVSQAAIAALEKQEFTTEADLEAGFTFEQFSSWGILGKSAGILARLYPPSAAPTPAAAPAVATPAKLYLGKEPLPDLVRRAASGDPEAVADLRERVEDKPLFVRDLKTGKMDVEASIACMNYVGGGTPVNHWGPRPTETLKDILNEKRLIHPLTGEELTPGDGMLEVPKERLIMLSYGILTGLIKPGSIDEDNLVERLKAKDLVGSLLRVSATYEVARLRGDAEVAEAERRLYQKPAPRRNKEVDCVARTPSAWSPPPAARRGSQREWEEREISPTNYYENH